MVFKTSTVSWRKFGGLCIFKKKSRNSRGRDGRFNLYLSCSTITINFTSLLMTFLLFGVHMWINVVLTSLSSLSCRAKTTSVSSEMNSVWLIICSAGWNFISLTLISAGKLHCFHTHPYKVTHRELPSVTSLDFHCLDQTSNSAAFSAQTLLFLRYLFLFIVMNFVY